MSNNYISSKSVLSSLQATSIDVSAMSYRPALF